MMWPPSSNVRSSYDVALHLYQLALKDDDQFRAMFVQNCRVDTTVRLRAAGAGAGASGGGKGTGKPPGAAADVGPEESYHEAGGLSRTRTRPTLNLLHLLRGVIENKHSTDIESPPPPPCVCISIHPTLKVSHVPISVECLFSTTLQRGVLRHVRNAGGCRGCRRGVPLLPRLPFQRMSVEAPSVA